MSSTSTTKSAPSTKSTPSKPNGSTSENPEPTASTSPVASTTTPASDKKPVTVVIPEALHRKAKVLAELSGVSLSDLVESQIRVVVKDRLPALLAGLDAGE